MLDPPLYPAPVCFNMILFWLVINCFDDPVMTCQKRFVPSMNSGTLVIIFSIEADVVKGVQMVYLLTSLNQSAIYRIPNNPFSTVPMNLYILTNLL